jgi:hypothetical protein
VIRKSIVNGWYLENETEFFHSSYEPGLLSSERERGLAFLTIEIAKYDMWVFDTREGTFEAPFASPMSRIE